jgi:hypothetical protein
MTGRLDDQQVGGTHYKEMAVTPWEFLQSCLTREELRGYFKGEAIVYLAREGAKGGAVDVSKARHVLQRLEELDATTAPVLHQPQALPYTAAQLAGFARELDKLPGFAHIAQALVDISLHAAP